MFLKTTVIKFNLYLCNAHRLRTRFKIPSAQQKSCFRAISAKSHQHFHSIVHFFLPFRPPIPTIARWLAWMSKGGGESKTFFIAFSWEKHIFYYRYRRESEEENSSYKFFRVISIPQKVNRKNMEQKSNSILHPDNGLFNGAVLHAHVSHWTLNFPPSIRLKSHLNAFFLAPQHNAEGASLKMMRSMSNEPKSNCAMHFYFIDNNFLWCD